MVNNVEKFIVLKHLIRGLLTGFMVFYIATLITGLPGISIGLIYGLYATLPYTSRRGFILSLMILVFISFIHYIHIVVYNWFNVYWELSIVLVTWLTLFWINTVERWRNKKS